MMLGISLIAEDCMKTMPDLKLDLYISCLRSCHCSIILRIKFLFLFCLHLINENMKAKEIIKTWKLINEGSGLNLFNYLEKKELTFSQKVLVYVLNIITCVEVPIIILMIIVYALVWCIFNGLRNLL